MYENNERKMWRLVEKHRTRKDKGVVSRMCTTRGGGRRKAKGWFLTARMAPPRQKAAEERNFSPKVRVQAGELTRHPGGATK